jgi:hypothetical protein
MARRLILSQKIAGSLPVRSTTEAIRLDEGPVLKTGRGTKSAFARASRAASSMKSIPKRAYIWLYIREVNQASVASFVFEDKQSALNWAGHKQFPWEGKNYNDTHFTRDYTNPEANDLHVHETISRRMILAWHSESMTAKYKKVGS